MATRRSWKRRRFLQLLGLSAAGAAACGEDAEQAQTGNLSEDAFDFIVVGSGAGGGPLACNLARAGHRVLLLEAGDDQGGLTSQQVPALHVRSTEEPTMQWDYFVKHYDDPDRAAQDSKFVAAPGPHHDPGVLYPRAGTLGGCTAHNAMITVYPHASDFDHIAAVTGDTSWSAASMRRYFELMENCLYIDPGDEVEADGHGFAGWLSTTWPDVSIGLRDLKLVKILLAAADSFAGESFWDDPFGSLFGGDAYPIKHLLSLLRRDLNTTAEGRDGLEGLFRIPQATDGQRRVGPRDFILRTVAEGYPLTVLTQALATRVLFDGTDDEGRVRASGVEVMVGEYLYRASPLADPADDAPRAQTRQYYARHEVILAAGAFNTPQLLKLSGIGPSAELAAFDIEPLVDLPGVGTNLQDRYEVGVVSEMSSDLSAIDDCTFGVEPDPCLDAWEEGKGPYTSLGAVGAIVLKSVPERDDTDLIIFGLPGMFRGYYPGYGETDVFGHKDRFTWAILKAHTENHAGTVTLRSADPRDTPDIRFRYFEEGTNDDGEAGRDLDAMLEGVRFVRSMNRRTDFKLLFSKYEELVPGPSYDDDDLRDFVRDEAWGHHASCTCPIGADDDPMAVLDSKLRVRGTTGLRVVDASVFPKIPGFFIVVPIYMVSEKATDDILADLGEVRA